MRLSNVYKYTILVIALALLSSCSGNNYESQINKILDWEKNNGQFSDTQFEMVFELIGNNPSTLGYDFSDANYLKVVTSDDNIIYGLIYSNEMDLKTTHL